MRRSEALLWDTLVFTFSHSGFKWKIINLMLNLQSTGMTEKIRTQTKTKKKKEEVNNTEPIQVLTPPNRA